MEEGEENRDNIEHEKNDRIKEVEHKFKEVIDMLVQNYSTNV